VITPRPIGATGFLGRLFGAAALNAGTYEEVEADPAATAQAVIVVVLSSVAAGFGARGFGGEGLAAIAFFSVVALMAWGAWSLVTYQIGVRILPDVDTQANLGELLRTIGFASGPGILRIFGVVPAMRAAAEQLAAVPTGSMPGPDTAADTRRAYSRVAMFSGIASLLLVVIVVLMAWKP